MAICKKSLYHNIALIFHSKIKENEQRNKLNEFVTNAESIMQVS